MSNQSFSNQASAPVQTKHVTGITSASPGKIHKVPKGAAVKIYPTSAGTATVYSTNTPQRVSDLDTDNAAVTASTNANWDLWDAGTVSGKTIQLSNVPVETVSLVVTSGTWTIEITV